MAKSTKSPARAQTPVDFPTNSILIARHVRIAKEQIDLVAAFAFAPYPKIDVWPATKENLFHQTVVPSKVKPKTGNMMNPTKDRTVDLSVTFSVSLGLVRGKKLSRPWN